jgi:hypothetical protein
MPDAAGMTNKKNNFFFTSGKRAPVRPMAMQGAAPWQCRAPHPAIPF